MKLSEQHDDPKLFTVINPVAGHADVDTVEDVLAELCDRKNWDHEIYTTTGEEDLAEVAQGAIKDGATAVLAAGGDGTVAGVVNGLVGTQTPLVVIPLGTGNGLARALGIPLDIREAINLLGEEHRIEAVDVMRVGERYFVLNVSAGISARAMSQTDPEEKQKKGVLAYIETIVKDFTEETETSVFELEIDGDSFKVEAVELLVSNGRILEQPPLFFGPRQSFTDGQLEVNILAASDAGEFVRLAWDLLLNPGEQNPDLQNLVVKERIRITSPDETLQVQADGEVLDGLPVDIELAPQGVRVVVPGD